MAEYIEREAAINAVRHAWAKDLEPTQFIDDIPTTDVEPVRHGQWEQFRLDWDDLAIRLKCSCCCKVVYERGFKYCPNCGARMDGGDDNGNYCYGWMDKMTDDPLPECRACPDHVFHAQDDMDAFFERSAYNG